MFNCINIGINIGLNIIYFVFLFIINIFINVISIKNSSIIVCGGSGNELSNVLFFIVSICVKLDIENSVKN